jgi:hypothetical protein
MSPTGTVPPHPNPLPRGEGIRAVIPTPAAANDAETHENHFSNAACIRAGLCCSSLFSLRGVSRSPGDGEESGACAGASNERFVPGGLIRRAGIRTRVPRPAFPRALTIAADAGRKALGRALSIAALGRALRMRTWNCRAGRSERGRNTA